MKWCRFEVDRTVAFGFLEDDEMAVEGTPFEAWTITPRRHRLDAVRLLVPVMPANFYAVGLNYRTHVQWAAERKGLKVQVPKEADVADPPLSPGDVVEIACDRIGVLRNRVVREDQPTTA